MSVVPPALRSTDVQRPSFEGHQEEYVRQLEAALLKRSVTTNPLQSLLAVISLCVVLGGGIVATVIRWHDIDLIGARTEKVEQELKALPSHDDLLYARRDLYDERMKNMQAGIDRLIAEVTRLTDKIK